MRRRRWRVAPLLLGMFLGSAVGLVVGLFVWALAVREPPIPPLTQQTFEQAFAQWQRIGPESYDLDVRLSGARSAEIHVQVRHGEATQVTRDGQVLTQRRTWEPWTVLGQFDTLEIELDNATRPGEVYNAPEARVVLRASFDERLGYPKQFQRRVLGTQYAIEWQVTRFDVVD